MSYEDNYQFEWNLSFNRINPNRTIPTPDPENPFDLYIEGFNRINPNRTIPTRN